MIDHRLTLPISILLPGGHVRPELPQDVSAKSLASQVANLAIPYLDKVLVVVVELQNIIQINEIETYIM